MSFVLKFYRLNFLFVFEIVVGPGIPPPNVVTGGFVGGVTTELRKLRRPKYPTTVDSQAPSFGDNPKSSGGGGGGGYGY